MNHSPEPWTICHRRQAIVDADNNVVVSLNYDEYGSMSVQPDTAERIVTCVNACRGISTEELQKLMGHGQLAFYYRIQKEMLDSLKDTEGKCAHGDKPMTTDQINELQPGPELDRAVGNACRCDVLILETNGTQRCMISRPDKQALVEFHPSTDLNDAFFAAERFGLFFNQGTPRACLLKNSDGWGVWGWSGGHEFDEPDPSIAPTPALAICRAILTLKK